MQWITRLSAGAAAAALALAFAGVARAGPVYSIQLPINMFGNLDQDDVPTCKDANNVSYTCGPTAAVNSFVWLQNSHPEIYDNNLVPIQASDLDGDNDVDEYDHMIATAIELGDPEYMDCTVCQGGTTLGNFIDGKRSWIEEHAPGTTVFKDVLNPNWDFLFNELSHGEDVELLLGFYKEDGADADNAPDRDGGHYITLTSFHWADADMDGVIDEEEGAFIDFIDPATGMFGTADIFQASLNGIIGISDYGVGGEIILTIIDAAISESFIPEPEALALFAGGVLLLLRRRRRG